MWLSGARELTTVSYTFSLGDGFSVRRTVLGRKALGLPWGQRRVSTLLRHSGSRSIKTALRTEAGVWVPQIAPSLRQARQFICDCGDHSAKGLKPTAAEANRFIVV
jgi:hypothetical protein